MGASAAGSLRCTVAALVLFALACAEAPRTPPRGVVLIVIDTLRADHLGSYGYARPTSPHIDAFARDATLFEQAIAPSPWTLPSMGTLMTGLYPSVHGARQPSRVDDLNWMFHPDRFQPVSALHESRETLAEILAAQGFATAGFVQGSYIAAPFGVAQGFELYRENATPGVRFDVEDALAWLDDEQPERFLLYLHVIEVHAPYAPAEMRWGFEDLNPGAPVDAYRKGVDEEAERFASFAFDTGYAGKADGSIETLARMQQARRHVRQADLDHVVALYDQTIAYTDHWIGVLLEGLAARGLDEESVILLTSDHGEEFLDHGRTQHNFTFYEEMLRVPLIVRVPGEGGGKRVTQTVGLVDVLPTLLDVLEVDVGPELQGRSLRPLWRGEALPERSYFGEASMVAGLEAVRTQQHKYVRHPRRGPELYDLQDDPTERRNRCRGEPDPLCEQLDAELDAWKARSRALAEKQQLPAPRAAEVDEATRERLRELGYEAGP